jgi:hypothetical protein
MALINTTTTGVLGSTFFGDGTGPLTVQQNGVTLGVYGNIPAFSAYTNLQQTVSNATFPQVAFQLEEFDTNSNFASNTFTPTIAGYYQFNFTIIFRSTSNITRSIGSIYKNGSTTGRQWDCPLTISGFQISSGSKLLYCNGTTDAITLYVYMEGSGTLSIGSTDLNTNYFSGVLVKAA